MSARYCQACLTTFEEDADRCPNLSCGVVKPDTDWGRVLKVGDLLDRHYRIVRPLAVGGAGLTYQALEVDSNGNPHPPDLAIKVLYAARASGSFLRRLSTEAQILREIDHDNIVKLRGFVHRDGHEPYLVTLFEHGGNLSEHLEREGALAPKVAAGILHQVLSALDEAHQRGVVHRDLKPDNVLLCEHVDIDEVPRIRVADFGIAKVSGGLGGTTKSGTFVGTPEFAAPEQFEGMAPTPAADVFAAGALFLHLLTGELPIEFTSRRDIESCHRDWLAHLPPKVDPEQLRHANPIEILAIQDILVHMMAVAPDRRWTVQQVLSRLEKVAAGAAELPRRETLELTDAPAPGRQAGPVAPLVPLTTESSHADDDVKPTPPTLEPVYGDGYESDQDPPEQASPDPETLEEAAGNGGCMAAIAGLGAVGILGLGVLAILMVAVLGGVAWQLGYFDSGQVVLTNPTPDPAPVTPDPKPSSPDPVPGTPDPSPETPDPSPETPDPSPETPDPSPETPDPSPETPDPSPETPDPSPETPDPVPGTPDPQPAVALNGTAMGAADPLRLDVQKALQNRPALKDCGSGVVVGTAELAGGSVVRVVLDPDYVEATVASCVANALKGTPVSASGERRARFAIRL